MYPITENMNMNRVYILRDLWDNWAHKEWFKYANYESETSNKIIIQTNFNPILEIPKFRIFMGNYPQVTYEFKHGRQ
jgi:hypothetical protein